MEREQIQATDSVMETLLKMTEGNPGAATVCGQLMKEDRGLLTLLFLDDMNIRGSQLWVCYKDYCDGDIAKLIRCAADRDEEMINMVNGMGAAVDGHVAVISGAQDSRPAKVRSQA